MKKELLEHLVRKCIREVISQVNEFDDETKGAPAPPADGQGTADQPEIPKQTHSVDDNPSDKETPEDVPSPSLAGVIFLNPKDKSKLQRLPIQVNSDDATIERTLHQQAAKIAGSKVQIALSTTRLVKAALLNKNSSIYLYLGKYDPESNEIFLMADKSLKVAKDSSISPEELSGNPSSALAPTNFQPLTADSGEYASRIASQGRVEPTGIDESLNNLIKKIVNEILDNK